jgi:hypothetical protein
MSSLLLITPINNKRGKYKEYLYDSNIKKPRSTQTLINAKKRKLENEFSKQKESSISQVVDNSNDQNVQLKDQQPHSNDKQHQSNDQLSYSINDQTNSIEFEPFETVDSSYHLDQSNVTTSNQSQEPNLLNDFIRDENVTKHDLAAAFLTAFYRVYYKNRNK